MAFTLAFVKLFVYGVYLAAPLLLAFMFAIVIIGQFVGKNESWTKFDSLYWSFITATTVGYGDIRPLQKLSKMLSIIIAFLGLIMTGIIVALALHAATVTFKEQSDLDLVQSKIESIKQPLIQPNEDQQHDDK